MRSCVVGIDASRNRSGGAKHHLIGLLGSIDPRQFGIARVHVWSYRTLLALLPDQPWLVKHNPPELEKSLLRQAWWQRRRFPGELRKQGCDILLSTDAGTVGIFEPSVVMSRDMLSYEPGEMKRYGFSASWLRLLLLRHVQVRSLRRARAAVFLTRYAAETIQRFTGPLERVAIIPHGVGDLFRRAPATAASAFAVRPIQCLYVSNADLYKHQWQVVRAVGELRKRGHDMQLTLAGGGNGGKAQRFVDEAVTAVDPSGAFVRLLGAVEHDRLPALIAECNVFIFASSCENMPNTLLEGMAGAVPIACSHRGPMPEVLQDGGVYFDPEKSDSIAAALEMLVTDEALCARVAQRAYELSQQYSWSRCAQDTWTFVRANVPV